MIYLYSMTIILTTITMIIIIYIELDNNYYCYQYDKTKVYSGFGYLKDINGTYYESIHATCDKKINWIYNIIMKHDNYD